MNDMDFHPSQIPIAKIFHLKDEKDASDAAQEMVKIGFFSDNRGFKVLMPKNDTKIAKRIGYTVTTSVTFELRKTGQDRNIRYWTYHEDKENYAIVFVSLNVLENLGFN